MSTGQADKETKTNRRTNRAHIYLRSNVHVMLKSERGEDGLFKTSLWRPLLMLISEYSCMQNNRAKQ